MPDIFHKFTINTTPARLFEGITTPRGLDQWWTKSSNATPGPGAIYNLNFGPGYNWFAVVTKYQVNRIFEIQMEEADADWLGTKIGFSLSPKGGQIQVEFYHLEWPDNNDHYRFSCYCWAMYLRILKRYLEYG